MERGRRLRGPRRHHIHKPSRPVSQGEALLVALEVMLELRPGPTVDHALLLYPRPPRLRDAILHEAEGSLVVGVCVYGDTDSGAHSFADVWDSEVETVHVGVELQRRVRGCGFTDQTRNVHLVGFPAVEDAARRMADGPYIRVVHRTHDALGHGLLTNPERGVYARHDEVQLGEHVVFVVEGTVPHDVHLGAAEEVYLTVLLVGLPHGLHLLLQALGREAVRD